MEALFTFLESILYLAICIVCISGLAGILFYRRTKGFENLNPSPKISYFSPKEYNTKREPTISVKTGIFVEDFLEFYLLANKFVVDMRVWFIFNSSLVDLNAISQFSFDKGMILSRSGPETKCIGDLLFAEYKVRLQFSTNLDFHAFPVDDHRFYLILKNELTTPTEIVFDVSETGFILSDKVFFTEWQIIGLGVETGYEKELLHRHIEGANVVYPCAVFFIDFSRKGIRKALIIVLPIILIFFVGFASLIFLRHADLSLIVYLNTASITGLIAYRFVVESISPDVGYLTLTDYIFILFLGANFVVFLIAAFLNFSTYSKETTRMIGIIFSLLIPVFVIFFMYWIIQKQGRKKCSEI